MYTKFLPFLYFFCFCFESFAVDCGDNNGFVKIDGASLGIGMYNTKGYVNKIKNEKIAEPTGICGGHCTHYTTHTYQN